jgi:FlaA1/EpsC-like NDP-sugar epimerase
MVFIGAVVLRFEGAVSSTEWLIALTSLGWVVGFRLAGLLAFGCERYAWRDCSLAHATDLAKAVSLGSIGLTAASLLHLGPPRIPVSVLLIDWGGAIMVFGGIHALVRVVERRLDPSAQGLHTIRALVLGTGEAGQSLIREIQSRPWMGFSVVGIVASEASSQGSILAGVRVLGHPSALADHVSRSGAESLLIPIPATPVREARALIAACRSIGICGHLVPGFEELLQGKMKVQTREVDTYELLRREPVTLDSSAIGRFLRGRVVLVTGASGSIGREICCQILGFEPALLVLLDHSENGVFYLLRELEALAGVSELVPAIADITDVGRIRSLMERYRPAVVFHAAAHKHVPMMEICPGEGIKNNVNGTRIIADESIRIGVEAFVMISTDKAVNPSSVMGACKRLAEMHVQGLADRTTTRLVTVRFGNVLGSTGSVVPIFREQIKNGGPITVTHPDMTRYFMTIPEAAQLVLQAGTFGRSGEIYVLDMGEPVSVLQLARDMIRLSGLVEDRDIEIEFTGARPGEKLWEELYDDGEERRPTPNAKIFALEHRPVSFADLEPALDRLLEAADGPDDRIIALISELVPEYLPGPVARRPIAHTREDTEQVAVSVALLTKSGR